MKITNNQLRQIIKEELSLVLEETAKEFLSSMVKKYDALESQRQKKLYHDFLDMINNNATREKVIQGDVEHIEKMNNVAAEIWPYASQLDKTAQRPSLFPNRLERMFNEYVAEYKKATGHDPNDYFDLGDKVSMEFINWHLDKIKKYGLPRGNTLTTDENGFPIDGILYDEEYFAINPQTLEVYDQSDPLD